MSSAGAGCGLQIRRRVEPAAVRFGLRGDFFSPRQRRRRGSAERIFARNGEKPLQKQAGQAKTKPLPQGAPNEGGAKRDEAWTFPGNENGAGWRAPSRMASRRALTSEPLTKGAEGTGTRTFSGEKNGARGDSSTHSVSAAILQDVLHTFSSIGAPPCIIERQRGGARTFPGKRNGAGNSPTHSASAAILQDSLNSSNQCVPIYLVALWPQKGGADRRHSTFE